VVSWYQRKRDLLCGALERVGYQLRRPEGTFYLFPRSPLADDIAFIRLLAEEGVLGVPGTGFRRPGYFRLSFTVPLDTIEQSISAFERAFARC
jgi:aspartate aminotransferase